VREKFCGFLTKRESFPNGSFEQWLSSALSIHMKQDPQKFSLHLNEISLITRNLNVDQLIVFNSIAMWFYSV